jgi:hypothetical protein
MLQSAKAMKLPCGAFVTNERACEGCSRPHIPAASLTEVALAERLNVVWQAISAFRYLDFVSLHSESFKGERAGELECVLAVISRTSTD